MRLIAHIGAQKTATTYIQHSLFQNADLLAEHGVYLPTSGRLELAPRSVCHHHLAWQYTDPERFRPKVGGWDALREEVAGVDPETVLISSEGLGSMVYKHDKIGDLLRELNSVSDDVVVVLVVREQLALINSSYAQAVKMFSSVGRFEDYAARAIDRKWFDFDAAFSPWYHVSGLRFVVVPFSEFRETDPLVALLAAADVEVPIDRLTTIDGELNTSLGPVGMEAARLLGRYLRGKHSNFSRREFAARKLYRVAAGHARDAGWCQDKFWGWTPELAEEAATRLKPANDAFAQAVWAKDWDLPMPVDTPRCAEVLDDLDSATLEDVYDFVFAMSARFERLRERGERE